MIYIVPESIK